MKEQITKPQVLTQSLRVKELITELLIAIGENPHRSGLKETPDRVAKSYGELFSGIHEATPRLKTFFREEKNDIVIVRDIPLFSMCEHHFLPFFGRAHIAYLPSEGKIVGLSKLARLTQHFSRRPQVQERISVQIAQEIMTQLAPAGVFVMIEATHLCMSMRGVQALGSITVTTALRGAFESDQGLCDRTLRMIKGGNV